MSEIIGALKIKKTVTVNGGKPASSAQYDLVDGTYTFTVTGTEGQAEGTSIEVTITLDDGEVTGVSSNAEIEDGYAVVSGLPVGKYVVSEDTTGLADRHITVRLTEAAVEYVIENGYDPVYGARPLKRFIQRAVETPIARLLIASYVPEGSEIIVYMEDDRIAVSFTAAPLVADSIN